MKINEIVSPAATPTTAKFSVRKVVDAISACRNHFGFNQLYYGNCGLFAIALSKWISERVGVKCGLVGVVIVYEGENTTLSMEQIRGRDMNHVFSFVEIGNRWYLFDGDGRVSEKVLNGWHSQTWHDYGYDPEKWEIEHGESPKPIGVNLAFGDLNAMSVAAVEEGTDHSGDWREFYQFLDTLA